MYLSTNAGAGCVGLGCSQGVGCCGGMGALNMDGSGLFGTGVFGTGVTLTDFSTWGVGEIGAVAVALFLLFAVVSTTGRGVEGVQKRVRKLRRRA
jgi:hypothetical protein